MAKKAESKEKIETKAEHKEARKPAPPKKAAPPKVAEKENFRGIVRIAGKDVKGEVPLRRALLRVRGIGQTMAVVASAALEKELSISPMTRVGELSEEQIDKIDAVLGALHTHGMPVYLMNRRGDYESGTNRHIIMNDLIFETTQDLEREKKVYSWKGYRHSYGQKVRGQRTRNTGRTGMAVGVLRKSIIAAQQAAKAPAAAAAPAAPSASPAVKAAEKKAAASPAEKK